jgi:hypothetical protein
MENNESGLEKLTDSIENVITGIPAPIRKNFIKAFGQLCTAAIDIPVAWLEGKSNEIRATTEARIQIIRKEGENISEQIEVPKEYISRAASKFASKVIKEQINLDEITLNAAKDLTSIESTAEGISDNVTDISNDWLNEFENLARLKSSDDMKIVFGKILSGEIVKPGSFSIRTVKLISQLDNQAAKLFQLFCSQTISLRLGERIIDARVATFSGNAASNSLKQYGLSFDNLNVLQEYGLIISDYNSYMPYTSCIVNEQKTVATTLYFQNKHYGLIPTDLEKFDKELKLHGVALTKAGKELLNIIPLSDAENYKNELIEFIKSKHLVFVEVKMN